jgi:uncharacterized metal-binding protein
MNHNQLNSFCCSDLELEEYELKPVQWTDRQHFEKVRNSTIQNDSVKERPKISKIAKFCKIAKYKPVKFANFVYF